MKKRITVIFALLIFSSIVFASCGNNDDNFNDYPKGSLDNWVITNGGKKYEKPISVSGSEYYTDGTAEKVDDGIKFSGIGGYYAREDGENGAGCGGYYTIPLYAKENGFSIEFSINTIGHRYDLHNGGVWDSWVGIGIMNKPEMFSSLIDIEGNYARGLVALILPLNKISNNSEISVFFYERANEFLFRSDTPIENTSVMDRKHVFEMVSKTDELGRFYEFYLDGIKLQTTIVGNRFDTIFPDGNVYVQIYMQNWNANPKDSDTEQEKTYKLNSFTVHSITCGGEMTTF